MKWKEKNQLNELILLRTVFCTPWMYMYDWPCKATFILIRNHNWFEVITLRMHSIALYRSMCACPFLRVCTMSVCTSISVCKCVCVWLRFSGLWICELLWFTPYYGYPYIENTEINRMSWIVCVCVYLWVFRIKIAMTCIVWEFIWVAQFHCSILYSRWKL